MARSSRPLSRAFNIPGVVLFWIRILISEYFCWKQDPAFFDLAHRIPSALTDRFCGIAKRHEVVLILSLFEHRAPGLHHNTAVVIDADGRLLGRYRKMHIPQDPGFEEKFYFTPGDTGFQAFDTKYGRIGVIICWDQWYPESARLTALKGAKIIFCPTAIGGLASEGMELGALQRDAWLNAVEKNKMKWIQVSDLKSWATAPVKLCNVSAVPYTVLVDPDGKVIALDLRGEELIKKIKEVLKK